MVQAGTISAPATSVEEVLRADLARSDAALGTVVPVLRSLMANTGHSLFSDEIVARVRGMVTDLARQLFAAGAEDDEDDESRGEDPRAAALAEGLAGHPGLLTHVHALALEWQLAERLQRRNGFDPALSPLLQERIAAPDAETAETAMAAMAAQVRFLQHTRRMELPLAELPEALFDAALAAARAEIGEFFSEEVGSKLREGRDADRSRLALIDALVAGMGSGAPAALAIDHAGVAIFLSTLALAAEQDRDLTVLSTDERQVARLAVALRAAGLKRDRIEAQLVYLHSEASLPEAFDGLRIDAAVSLLASADVGNGD